MNSNLLGILLFSAIVILVSLLILLIPFHVMGTITSPFSFRTFGIRKIRRWNAHTDTLGNFFLWVSLLFCIAAPVIPYFQYIYAVWLTFSWLCSVARAVRLKDVSEKWKRSTVLFLLNLLYGFSLVAALGLMNHGGLIYYTRTFWTDIQNGQALHPMYYMTSPVFVCCLAQIILMLVPLYSFWSQFKYMRLENTYKARFMGFYIIKQLIVIAVVFFLGTMALGLTEDMYNVPAEERLSEGARPAQKEKEDNSEQGKTENEESSTQGSETEKPERESESKNNG